MVVNAVVFDLDGTISSFNVDYTTVRSEVRSMLIANGVPGSLLAPKESIFEMLNKTEIFLRNSKKLPNAIDDLRQRSLGLAEKYELEAAKCTSVLPGVRETLAAIKKLGLKIGLCTINGERSAQYILNRFRIRHFFDAVVSRDSVRHVKPNVEHLESVLLELGVKAQETVLVGDGKSDMACASELKAIAVGLPTGIATAADLINSGANYIITSIAELPSLIGCIDNDFISVAK